MLRRIFLYILISVVLTSCESLNALYHDPAQDMADWQPLKFDGDDFEIVGWQKPRQRLNKEIRIYIEGDGFAWASVDQPSSDPTPRSAVGMLLARSDAAENVIYLARPCQFSARAVSGCEQNRWWTSERYSRRVVDRYHAILTQLKTGQKDIRFELIGYSGGAAIAAILAAERTDVMSLRTVAGNLDTEYVNEAHQVSPMPHSLNPIQFATRLHLPQLHFVGKRDQVVPRQVASRFIAAQLAACANVIEVDGPSHQQGWDALWPQLLNHPLPECK